MEIHKDNTNVVICKYSLYLEYENKDIEKMSDVEKRKVYLLREWTKKLHLVEKTKKEIVTIKEELESLK